LDPTFTESARKLGTVSALGIVLLSMAYALVLIAGLLALQSPQQPIGEPAFTILEILILFMAPMIIVLFATIHAWAPVESKTFSLVSLVFACLLVGLTCGVHFVILTVSRQSVFSDREWMPLLISFKWPSVVYALDILAWDVFFALSVLFAAPAFGGSRLAAVIRVLLLSSGILALAGLSGVPGGNMQLRDIGIIGYVGVFPIAALLLAILFYRAKPGV
jgi:hypothetical protein